ncbi:MAG: hypothetical protein H8F28_16355 [Fibrella sp.]|nr:hypothetical protein [Armatimonadota bacterium]
MFRIFYEIVWVSVLVGAVISYLSALILHFVRQSWAPFSLLIPEVIVGVLLTGAVIGIFYGIILFFLRHKPMVFCAAVCGAISFAFSVAGVIFTHSNGSKNSTLFNSLGCAMESVQGATIAAVVLYVVRKFGKADHTDAILKEAIS